MLPSVENGVTLDATIPGGSAVLVPDGGSKVDRACCRDIRSLLTLFNQYGFMTMDVSNSTRIAGELLIRSWPDVRLEFAKETPLLRRFQLTAGTTRRCPAPDLILLRLWR